MRAIAELTEKKRFKDPANGRDGVLAVTKWYKPERAQKAVMITDLDHSVIS